MSTYTDAKTIAQVLLNQRDNLTTETIRKCVDDACSHYSELGARDRDRMVRELEITYQTVIGESRELVGDDEGWSPWLPERRGSIAWEYWRRYEELLKQGPMNFEVRAGLDESTDRVLALLGDPCRTGSWDRRGLVVGLVQSGKTSHYIGLVNKAADAGYKVIVILTGFTESLRVQTQIRAEEGFLGYYREPAKKRSRQAAKRIGVGRINPGKRPDSVTTRQNDFKKTIAGNFGIGPGGKELLFVIKKNVGVLNNLLNWIEGFGNARDDAGRSYVRNVPLLVIDDESDVGSIDTRKGVIVENTDDPDPEHEPSRINEQIRRLLSLFDQSSYVGYTATPFANVLIHDGGRTNELGEDLFPRSFIHALATPSDHVGPSLLFGSGIEGSQSQPLPLIRHIPTAESEGEAAWIPPVHKKDHKPSYNHRDAVPPSLREAILSFILVCAARRLRGSGTKHNSMLVHVTRFNDVQERVEHQVKHELKGIVDRLRVRTADRDLLLELRAAWDRFAHTTKAIAARGDGIFKNPYHAWEEIEGEILAAASAISVRTINGLAGEVLDYEEHREDGLSVIAIGGDKLSRGLTLEGLSVSYFLRCSRMYDTLMQMGRWFGYRPGYLDLCRLYTTRELCEWFGHIATATEELRQDFELMVQSGATPRDFGLRVLSHPEMMVTSQVKMRHSETIHISFQGKAPETNHFLRNAAAVEANFRTFTELLEGASQAGTEFEPRETRGIAWRDVPTDLIVNFLSRYREHEAGIRMRCRLLVEYIEQELKRERLTSWTVLVARGGRSSYPLEGTLTGRTLKLVERGWKLSGTTDDDMRVEKQALIEEDHFRIGVLINPPDEAVDLDDDERTRARTRTVEAWERDPVARTKFKRPTRPAGRFVREQRDPTRGLLIIYPLEPSDQKSEARDIPIVGFVVSFPSCDAAASSTVAYTVNNVWQQQELNFE